ncbi:hypothetical protein TSUD_257030 [Trifolium subterraneum]|uniref:Uncharacterized protein n=1 Tax=Trifolium subterraneum TaxID=3900 RepID=A0A2Z6MXC5_TRISU|nr:hypothetical protein TSUD_257030 [Trifolium subterraneum]
MTQTIVIDQLPLHSEKHKNKIFTICLTADGVTAVNVVKEGNDSVVIKGGDHVDPARITECLRQKVTNHARLVSVVMED